ncbi:MAG TPA: TolC family protein, partial [Pyrinomonadaceae bacterium]|nr:TolC family protein [Pyrinomonadaceae bacterium]
MLNHLNHRHITAIAIMLIALATTAIAQNNQNARVGIDPTSPKPITLQEAIRLALENNNDIATSRIDVEMSEYDLTAARGAYDPLFTSRSNF